jgi:putative hydrolase of the HAD superfamily
MTTETALCFDLDGTLVQYQQGFSAILESVFERELDTATEEMSDAYNDGFFSAFEDCTARPYHAGMAAALDAAGTHSDGGDTGALVAALRQAEFDATTVTDAVRDCLSELATDDATAMVVLTDGVGDWQRAKLDHHDLDEYFDAIVVSYDVGGHKATGEPYAAVRERIDADEYVMVGDSYESDVEAAREAEFVPIHYEDADTDLFSILSAML